MRKLGLLLCLSIILTSCAATKDAQEEFAPIDPCVQVRESAQQIITNLPDMDEVGKTIAKLEVLRWAFLVTGDPQCFSNEMVATAQSAITLIGASGN